MRKIYFWVFLLSILAAPSAYAGCFAAGNAAYYWGSPSSKIEVSYSQSTLTTETAAGTRIGTMKVTFSCPYYVGPNSWQIDQYLGGSAGYIYVPLPEFNFINNNRLEHNSGWIYLAPEGIASSKAKFFDRNGNSWNFPNIFLGFSDALGGNPRNNTGPTFTYGIYTNRSIGGNVASNSKIISMMTSATGNQITYRSGGLIPGNRSVTPTVTNNSVTLNYTNTVTCSITSNTNNLNLGVVNIHGDLNTPLATIVLTMKCGLGPSGGNMTSNYPSFIIAGSARMNSVTPKNATSEWLAASNSVGLRLGNGWGLRFRTGDAVNINSLNKISIPVYPYKYGSTQGNSVDWNGAVSFEIAYN
ncbi:hypothetical protein OGV71_19975 [Citrobacter sp. Cf088]|uniref:hypothetical protein n=1 Tax=Citrobacter sp. Cf088 TaxID=2985055 RepID=UPI00257498B3|nr:hypothetical protein [Citrobacter sp. Cf088]MDM3223991.1 hypothetical protein [Citrobacter sp. Cf088]